MLATGLSKTVLKSGSVGKLVVTTVLHFNMQTIYSETRGTPHDLNWNNASKHPTSTFDLNGQARAWSRGKKNAERSSDTHKALALQCLESLTNVTLRY